VYDLLPQYIVPVLAPDHACDNHACVHFHVLSYAHFHVHVRANDLEFHPF